VSGRAQRALAVLLVALAGALAYAPALDAGFLNLDDKSFIVDNPLIPGGLTTDSLRWALTADVFEDSDNVDYWQPATLISRLVDGSLYGLDPRGHHATSVLLHLANAVLLLFLLAAASGRLWRSTAVALVFATHPLHVSSVAWVAERKDVLAGLFSLLSLAAFAKFAAAWREHLESGEGRTVWRAVGWYLLLVLGYALCLMSKPMTLPLPLVMLVVSVWPIRRERRPGLLRLALSLAPLLLLAAGAVFLYTRVHIAGSEMKLIGSQPRLSVAAGIATALAAYPARLVWPVDLQHLYAVYTTTTPGWQVAASLAFIVAASATAAFARRRPYLAAGWLWYLVSLLPVVPLFQSNAAADRFSYFPMIGVTTALVWGIGDLAKGRWLSFRVTAMAAAAAALILTTRAECRYWKDSITLFSHLVELNPKHYLAYRNLGVAQAMARDSEKALASFRAGIAVNPNYPSLYHDLGVLLQVLGKLDEALLNYSEAAKLDPFSFDSLYDMGEIYMRQGNYDSALESFLGALRVKPRDPPTLYGIGFIHAQRGELDDAADFYGRALAADPERVLYMNCLGTVLLRQGRPAPAAELFQRALEREPDTVEYLLKLGTAMLDLGDRKRARDCFARVLAKDPGNGSALAGMRILDGESPAAGAARERQGR
jgi:tetratricopeptide (TPR) repeat protein